MRPSICIDAYNKFVLLIKFLYSDRDDMPENLGTTTAHERQKVHFRLMCVALKRLCLSSLICLKGVVSYTQATVPQLHHLACRFFSASTVVLQFSFCLLFFSSRWLLYRCVTIICNASVNSTCALPLPTPGLLRALCTPCQYRGWGICKFYTARGVGHLPTPGQFASF